MSNFWPSPLLPPRPPLGATVGPRAPTRRLRLSSGVSPPLTGSVHPLPACAGDRPHPPICGPPNSGPPASPHVHSKHAASRHFFAAYHACYENLLTVCCGGSVTFAQRNVPIKSCGGASNYSFQLSRTNPTFSDPLVPLQSPDKTSLVVRVFCQQSRIPRVSPTVTFFLRDDTQQPRVAAS